METYAILDNIVERTIVLPELRPSRRYKIPGAFTAAKLVLSEHSCPVAGQQRRYTHLKGLSILPIDQTTPQILIGADIPSLVNPLQSPIVGPPGRMVAILTRVDWSLQGPASGGRQTQRQPLLGDHHRLGFIG